MFWFSGDILDVPKLFRRDAWVSGYSSMLVFFYLYSELLSAWCNVISQRYRYCNLWDQPRPLSAAKMPWHSVPYSYNVTLRVLS